MNVTEKHPVLARLAETRGTPAYVYFVDEVRARVHALRGAFGETFGVSYAVKSNPNPGLLARLIGSVDTLDVSSGGELALAIAAGWDASRISFTGPGKRATELEAAVGRGVGEVVVESVAEAVQLQDIAARAGLRQRVLVRLAPVRVPKGFGDSMAGKAVAFGIDEEVMDEGLTKVHALKNLDLVGFHIYSGTQCLQASSIAANYCLFIDLFRRATALTKIAPEKLVFGAGIGIPYHKGQAPVSLEQVADKVASDIAAMRAEPAFKNSQLLLEAGRYLVGQAGVLLTRVIHKKDSRGTTIAICDAGLNNQLAAAGHFGMIMKRNYPMSKVWSENPPASPSPFTLVGPLCTSIDTMGRAVVFDGLEPNDVIAIHCSGAYGLTASPMYFISHAVPSEYLVEGDGDDAEIVDVSRSFGGYPE